MSTQEKSTTATNPSASKSLGRRTADDDKDKAKTSRFEKLTIKANGVCYLADRIIGNGSFGVVMQASVVGTGEVVAIKKVLQDKRFKNRELQIMKMLNHINVIALKNSFYTSGPRSQSQSQSDEVYLNLVLEYMPETVYRVARQYAKLKQPFPLIYIKVYMYQLCRALAYIHSVGICHRDIKPQNLLLDATTGVLKLCDFGSAKILVRGETNVSYICSRYYRAPELIFGATNYMCAIDIWSMGCVLAELLLGQPLFPGDSGVDQMVEIIKVLGTPTREQLQLMNPNYTAYNFPEIQPHSWHKIFRARNPPPDAIDLISKVLSYTPSARLKAFECCAHPFFDDLRDPSVTLPNGRPLPPLFNFSLDEQACAKHLLRLLVPPHAIDQLQKAPAAAAGGLPTASTTAPPAAATASASAPPSATAPTLGAGPSVVTATSSTAGPLTSAASATALGPGSTVLGPAITTAASSPAMLISSPTTQPQPPPQLAPLQPAPSSIAFPPLVDRLARS